MITITEHTQNTNLDTNTQDLCSPAHKADVLINAPSPGKPTHNEDLLAVNDNTEDEETETPTGGAQLQRRKSTLQLTALQDQKQQGPASKEQDTQGKVQRKASCKTALTNNHKLNRHHPRGHVWKIFKQLQCPP